MSEKKPSPTKSAPRPAGAKSADASKHNATKPIRRRDATGHLDPHYAAHLRAEGGHSRDTADNVAFLAGERSDDELAEELGEEAVAEMTTGEYQGEDVLDRVVEEERGGPFVESTAGVEYAEGTDPSNPSTATREPFPKT
jgi:hypothetical protein